MKHIFATRNEQPRPLHLQVEDRDQEEAVAAMRIAGYRVAVLDEDEREKYAALTTQLAALHPELVV
jgi:hypothetical protein